MDVISIDIAMPECWSQHGKNFASGYVLGFTNYKEWIITQLWKINSDNKYDYVWETDIDEYITHWTHLPSIPK